MIGDVDAGSLFGQDTGSLRLLKQVEHDIFISHGVTLFHEGKQFKTEWAT